MVGRKGEKGDRKLVSEVEMKGGSLRGRKGRKIEWEDAVKKGK